MDSETVEICGSCGRAGTDLLRCSRCQAVYYCNAACQRDDWRRVHKRLCPQLNVAASQQLHHRDHASVQEMHQLSLSRLANNPLHIQKMYEIFLSKDESDDNVSEMKRLFRLTTSVHKRQALLFQSLSILMQLPKKMAKLRTVSTVCIHCIHLRGVMLSLTRNKTHKALKKSFFSRLFSLLWSAAVIPTTTRVRLLPARPMAKALRRSTGSPKWRIRTTPSRTRCKSFWVDNCWTRVPTSTRKRKKACRT